MSLSKRDTFVRWLDPLQIIWEDAEQNVHISITDALKRFELADTPEHRQLATEIIKGMLPPHAKTVERAGPDSDEYYTQPTS